MHSAFSCDIILHRLLEVVDFFANYATILLGYLCLGKTQKMYSYALCLEKQCVGRLLCVSWVLGKSLNLVQYTDEAEC